MGTIISDNLSMLYYNVYIIEKKIKFSQYHQIQSELTQHQARQHTYVGTSGDPDIADHASVMDASLTPEELNSNTLPAAGWYSSSSIWSTW